MSEENAEIALRQIDALNRGDVDAFLDLSSPDVEWEDAIFWSEPMRIYRGKAELKQWLNRVLEPWESFHIEVEEIREAADERVLVGGLLTTRGKGSGAETQTRGCFVFWIANGKISRRQVYLDRAEALEAAGLQESSGFARDAARAMPAAESNFLRAFREVFEQGNRAWNAGDVKSAYATLPGRLEYRLAATWPEARVLRSRDEVIAFFEGFQETFPDARTASQEYLEGDHGTVVVGFRVAGSGRTSGAGGEMEIWQVWEFTDEDDLTVTRVTEFTNRREAVEAAGLAE